MNKKALILILIVAAFSLAACAEAGGLDAVDSFALRNVGAPETAPEMAAPDMAGEVVSFSRIRWATL